MKKLILLLIFILLGNCKETETEIESEFHPKAIVIIRVGDVRAGGKPLALTQEISDQDVITVGPKSLCDLQILDSDSLVVIRLKENSKFRLSGKQLKSQKVTNFIIEAGNTMLNVSKLGKNDAVNAVSPVSTVGVRGTKYDLNVSPNGNTKINVIEGTVAMKVRIPELEKYSKSDVKKSKTLSTVNNSLNSKEIIIKKGQSSEMPKAVGSKILKETGLEKAITKNDSRELDRNIDTKDLSEKLEKIKNEDLKIPIKEIDKSVMSQRLKEYSELTPIEKEKINDKSKRNGIIQSRFKKWEKSWFEKVLDWGKKKLKF
ncbi:MAG: FecR domain-containing protein [Leptospiraceae bacterium]|nr:FecR domain-containing protein [Leptospiraceae bacterium]MCP5496623.1 FecR domain-containing protein [Leptospiraceae bacterium]